MLKDISLSHGIVEPVINYFHKENRYHSKAKSISQDSLFKFISQAMYCRLDFTSLLF